MYDRVWRDEEAAKTAVRRQRGQPEPEEEKDVEESVAESESSIASEDIDLDRPPRKLSIPKPRRPPPPTKSLTPALTLAEIAELDRQPLNEPSLRAAHIARTLLVLDTHPNPNSDPPVDPFLSTYDTLTRAEANLPEPKELTYGTDPANGVCACKSFLLSRFLICKHLIRLHTRQSRPPLYFNVVQCQRRGRRYVVPSSAIELEGLLRGSRAVLNSSAVVKQLAEGTAATEEGGELRESAPRAPGGGEEGGEGVAGEEGGDTVGRGVALDRESERRGEPTMGVFGQCRFWLTGISYRTHSSTCRSDIQLVLHLNF